MDPKVTHFAGLHRSMIDRLLQIRSGEALSWRRPVRTHGACLPSRSADAAEATLLAL